MQQQKEKGDKEKVMLVLKEQKHTRQGEAAENICFFIFILFHASRINVASSLKTFVFL